MEKKIAIQIQHDAHWREMLQITAESGFKFVSMGFGSSKVFHKDGWEKEMDEIGNELAKNGLRCVMTHTPYYDLLISAEKIDEVMERALLRCMTATGMLGGEISAVHPRSFLDGQAVDGKKSLAYNLKSFSVLAEEIGKYGAKLGVENLPQFPGLPIPFYSCKTEDHIELIDKLDSENTCAVWDFGHSHLLGGDDVAAIRALGKRIEGTHVHNNYWHDDSHFVPSRGTIDWNATLGAMKENGYKGYLTLEVNYDYSFAIRSFIKHCYDCVAELEKKL